MKLSLRARPLLIALLVSTLGAHAAAQIRPVPKPPVGGGTYTGPGDTVPPPCTGPGCPPPPPPPPPTICFNGPCTSDYSDYGCFGPCFGTPQALPGINSVQWTDASGNLVAPPCMQGGGTVRVYNITVQNLFDAASAANNSPDWPRSNLCFWDTCPNGIDAIFVYTTLPFQAHPEGIQMSNGGYAQVCGMSYGLKLAYDDGTCVPIEVGGDPNLFNSTFVPMECTEDLLNFTLQFDESCLVPILNQWGAYGVYSPFTGLGFWLDPSKVAFVVAVKCCGQNGDPTCQ